MKFNLERRQLINLVKWIISLNMVFLAGTFLFHYYFYKIQNANWENGSVIKYFIVEFSLATENVLAAWYSSMLLLLVGLIFFINYLIQKREITQRNKKIHAYGWLIFSGIFCLLSLDELASLHERLGNINALNPLGDYSPGWVMVLAIPIALVGGFMIWFCLLQLKRSPPAAIFAVAGILLFASIPVQEYYEMQAWQAVDYIETWQRPVGFLLLEEGCELFGTTSFLISGLLFAYSGTATKKLTGAESSLKLRLPLINRATLFQCAAGLLILTLLLLTLVNSDLLLLEGDRGKRENWFPAATTFFSSLLCLYLYLRPKSSQTNSRKIFLYLSAFCFLLSAYYGANLYSYVHNPKESFLKLSLVALFVLTTMSLAIKFWISVKDFYTRAAIALWACLSIPAFVIFSWYSAALIFLGFYILSISLLHLITSKVFIASTSQITNKNPI